MYLTVEENAEEERTLNEKIDKVYKFTQTRAFQKCHWEEKRLLRAQIRAMSKYSVALCDRLELARKTAVEVAPVADSLWGDP